MSTGAVFSFTLAVALAACAGSGAGTTTAGDRVLVADPSTISIKPGATGPARFVLTSGGVPIAGQTVNISIADDPNPQGATLARTSAVTDVSGVAQVDVHAGDAATLKIRATAGSTPPATLTVVVALGTGSIMVTPFFAVTGDSAAPTTGIDVRLVGDQACAEIPLTKDPMDPDAKRLAASGGTVLFDLVSTGQAHAVVGRAHDMRNAATAVGCVDVDGSSLVDDSAVEIWLPLHDAVPDPVGSFTLSSTLDFAPPLAAAAAIAAPWRDLSDCPLDPAQLFLDCIVDALSPATADDPLDCVPNPAAGGEGALGDLFATRRGVPIPDGTGVATACRSASDTTGAPSLDAIAQRLFGNPTPALVVDLPAIGDVAAHILDTVSLTSTLTVASTGLPDRYVVTHTLGRATFFPTTPASTEVDLASLALPTLTAYATATTSDGQLVIDSHGFSLRLGRLARAAFPGAALASRGVEPDIGGLVAAIAALARSDDGSVSACAAFDRSLCAAVGSGAGCLATACPAGLGALAAKLDGAFDAADGTGMDFNLSGSATLVDQHNDGAASQLGQMIGNPKASAIWSIDLRTAAGRARVAAAFVGTRN